MIDEERIAKLERNDKTLAEGLKALVESSLHHSSMMDDFFRGMQELRESIGELKDNQANTDVKLAALVDAQIRAEDEIKVMREGINQLREDMSELRGITKELSRIAVATDKRVDALEEKRS